MEVDFVPSLGPDSSALESRPLPLVHYNVPGALDAVPSKRVWVQSPNSPTSKLTRAWKFEVRMAENWYEAYMDEAHPSVIHSVIDWASDAALAPIPTEPKPEVLPKYRVWNWGINDPSEGTRSLETGYDVLASPIGWHAIPAAQDPSAPSFADPTLILNSTTTWGNNVRAVFSSHPGGHSS